MEGIQINPALLEAIFLDKEKFTPQVVKEITKWYQQLEPSVHMTQFLISSFIFRTNFTQDSQESENLPSSKEQEENKNHCTQVKQKQNLQRLSKAVQDIPKTLFKLQQHKCPKNFLRAYISFVKKNLTKIQHLIKREYILEQWNNVASQLLETYCETFQITVENYVTPEKGSKVEHLLYIKSQDFDKKIFGLIDKKQYTNCMTLIKFANCQKHHINKLLEKMSNNKEASKAADYVKSLKLNPADYPALAERLYKNTARHFLTKNGWEYAEQIFGAHPEALACIVQDLIFKKKLSEALSVWYRNECCRKFITKEQALHFLKPFIDCTKDIKLQKLKENMLQKDEFGPSNKQKYFSLEDFGFREDQIKWIDENTNNIAECLQDLLSSQILGIDTESIVGQTKFDKSQHSKFEEAATIQIATRSKIYLIDGFTVKHIPQVKQTILKYIKNDGLIVGHTLDNDMDCLLKSVGCSDEEIKELKGIKVVDVWKLFKAVFPKHRFSSLAFITEKMLGKQLCKQQTLTNWQRRPLRRNQIHYAAMDALIVIKIYDKFVQEVGEQMIEFYCSMDANDF